MCISSFCGLQIAKFSSLAPSALAICSIARVISKLSGGGCTYGLNHGFGARRKKTYGLGIKDFEISEKKTYGLGIEEFENFEKITYGIAIKGSEA